MLFFGLFRHFFIKKIDFNNLFQSRDEKNEDFICFQFIFINSGAEEEEIYWNSRTMYFFLIFSLVNGVDGSRNSFKGMNSRIDLMLSK